MATRNTLHSLLLAGMASVAEPVRGGAQAAVPSPVVLSASAPLSPYQTTRTFQRLYRREGKEGPRAYDADIPM